jgi:hypothetical protein
MTVSSSTRKSGPYIGDGVNTAFPFDFKVFTKEDVQPVFTNADGNESDLVLDSDYSVLLNLDQDQNPGGTVTYPIQVGASILSAAERLTLIGGMVVDQQTDITNAGRFLPQVQENAFDKLTILIQQLQEVAGRTLRAAVGTTVALVFPAPSSGKFIRWRPDLTGLENVDAGTDSMMLQGYLADKTVATRGPAMVAYNPALNYAIGTIGAAAKAAGITPQDFWLPTDPDWTNAFERWALAGGNYIPDGNYILKRQITLNGARSLRTGDVVLDFSQATSAASFPNSACLYANAGALTRISDLAADVVKGASTISFVSSPALQRGDVLIIYNPTDYSWSGDRPEYRAGEFVEVDSNNGTVVKIFGSLFDNYAAAAVQIYRLPRASFTLTGGRLKVIGCKAAGFSAVATAKFEAYAALGLDNLSASGSPYAGSVSSRCFNIYGTGLDITQANDVANGTDYGLVFSNCQKVRVSGKFAGGRHGVMTGGDSQVGCVPCRDGIVSGNFSNAATTGPGLGAVNCHGNTEYWRYDGTLDGGWTGGGNHNGVTPGSTLIAKPSQNGIAIYFGEMVGTDFSFAGVNISSRGNPSAGGTLGVIDMGGSSTAMGANTKYGGTLDFSNVKLDAPDATRGVVMVNRGCTTTEPILVKTSGMNISRLAASPVLAFTIAAPVGGGKAFEVVDTRGMVVPTVSYSSGSPYSISAAGVTKLRGWSRSGTASGVASTGAAILSIPVVFDTPAPAIPRVVITSDRGRVGQSFGVNPSSVTAAGFTLNVYTVDGANFVGAVAFSPAWSATVEQN